MFKTSLTVALMALASTAAFGQTREQIRIVGSGTLYPFTTTVAENFGKMGFKTPIVEGTGTGAGMKLFCEANSTADATNASRRMKAGEFETCAKNGAGDILEFKIGFDGLTLAMSKKTAQMNLTRMQLFLALAKEVPNAEGKLVANPNKMWSDIDASLPARKIDILGPSPISGTRDTVHELVMEAGAEAIPAMKALKAADPKAFEKAWKTMREDGAYVEVADNFNLIAQKLEADVNTLGFFGYSYLESNAAKLHAAKVEGVDPTFDTVASGTYKVSRPLFVYIKKANIAQVTGLDKFIAEYTSNKAAGEGGYLEKKGLVPLPKADLDKMRADMAAQKPLSVEGLSK